MKNVCISFAHSSFESFDKLIFGEFYTPHNVVVVFSEWRGFSNIYIPGAAEFCKKGRKYSCQKPPSARLLRDAELYADKYPQYIAIAGRFEKPVASYWELKPLKYKEAISERNAEATRKWVALKRNTSISSTFLGFDYGKFGSDTFRRHEYFGSQKILERFHQTVYNNSFSITEWEQSFEEVCQTDHIAYINLLQLQVSAHAKCIIFVGTRSNYHKVLNQEYLRHHPTNACVHAVGGVGSVFC